MNITTLPDDILQLIFSRYLPPSVALSKLSSVCRRFNKIVHSRNVALWWIFGNKKLEELTPRRESLMPKKETVTNRMQLDAFFRELASPECTLTPQQIGDTLDMFVVTSSGDAFIKKMIARYIKSSDRNDKHGQGVIYGVIRVLLLKNFASLNMKSLIHIHLFITSLIEDKTLADVFHAMLQQQFHKVSTTVLSPKPTGQSHFGGVSNIEIAQKLTLVEQRQFRQLKPKELVADCSSSNPQVKALKNRFNNNTTWILSTILTADDDSRPFIVMKFIAVAEYLRQFHNYQVLNAFVTALNDSRISRLKRTWACVQPPSLKAFQELNELMSIDGIYAAYKKELLQAPQACIPYMGLYLRDLTYIRENSPKDSIDFEQQKKVRAIVDRLKHFQKGTYSFGERISNVQITGVTTLLNEDELYELSYKIEPRTQPKYALPKPGEGPSESCTNSPIVTKKRHINDENNPALDQNVKNNLAQVCDVLASGVPKPKHKRVAESTPSSRNGSRSTSPSSSNSSLRSLSMSMTISPSSSLGRAIGRQVATLRRTLSDKKLADHFSPLKKDDKKENKKLATTKFDLSSKAKIMLTKTLGRGGSASAVYLGMLGKRPTPVAIKRFDLKIFGDDEEVMNCIFKELKLAAIFHGLPHNNIVEFIGQRTIERESVDLIMECYQDNLKSFIQRKKQENGFMDVHQIIEFSLQLASAINYLHSLKQPIVHLDIKPDNIFMEDKGGDLTLKLGDFGEAQTLKKADVLLFTPNVGTTEYRAPEVFGKGCDDNQGYSLKADIWSFGMVLYELMTLSVPYQLDDYNFFQLPSVIEAGIRPTLPDEVWTLVNAGPDIKLWTSLINIFSDTTHKVPACRPTATHLIRKLGALCQ